MVAEMSLSTPDDQVKKVSPFRRLLLLIAQDSRELLGISIYALLNSLLLLAIPLAAQGMVNVTAAGLALQPLLVLAAALFAGLLFAGILTCLRYMLAEVVLERIFCRVALGVAEKLPTVKNRYLWQRGGPELMNRFFDVINIQKSWFKLVYDGPGAVLEIIIGLSLLAFYGTELFMAAALFVLAGGAVVMIGGLGGIKSSIAESAEKYRVAEWLEEMVRCRDSLQLNSRVGFWSEQADDRVVSYLGKRRQHFRVLLRQVVLHYLITAVALAGMLGFGGYLVVTGQLSLGQLVAAELVVWSLFKATEKLLRACDAYFDLLTGLDKIGYITDLPVVSEGKAELKSTGKAAELVVEEVSFAHSSDGPPLLRDISFEVKAGERLAVLGLTGVGKSSLLRLLGGYATPHKGSVEFDQVDLREISPESKAANISYLSEKNELFAGSVIDNVAVGRECDLHRVRELLTATGAKEVLRRSQRGGFAPLTSAGSTLSAGEQKGVLLSRALLGRPRLLLIDDSLGQFSEPTLDRLVKEVFQAEDRATIITTATMPQIVAACDRVLILEEGTLVEDDSPARLAANPSSRFVGLYPALSRAIATRAVKEAP